MSPRGANDRQCVRQSKVPFRRWLTKPRRRDETSPLIAGLPFAFHLRTIFLNPQNKELGSHKLKKSGERL
jgi:hypothetical protein